MKTFLPLFLSAGLFISSCSTYKYVTLDSQQLRKNDRKEFVWENDTMRLTYNFNGQNGPLTITIYNKTTQPLFIDWKKSALIQNANSTSLYNSKIEFSGTSNSNGYTQKGGSNTSSGTFSGSLNLPEWIEFIPPQSRISKSLPEVVESTPDLKIIPGLADQKEKDNNGIMVKFRQMNYSDSSSPVQFKCYLTFALENNNVQEFSVEHSFYANSIQQSQQDPDMFFPYQKEGDKLYVKQSM